MFQHREPKPRTIAAWVIERVPLPFLTHAYEMVVAIVLVVIAFPVLTGGVTNTSIHAQVPHWIAIMWGWSLLLGATMTVYGLAASVPRMEWGGQLFQGYVLTLYAAAIAVNAPWSVSGVTVVIFGALGAVGFWRAWKITNQPLVQKRLAEESAKATRRLWAR